jgi:hypothetical protein
LKNDRGGQRVAPFSGEGVSVSPVFLLLKGTQGTMWFLKETLGKIWIGK